MPASIVALVTIGQSPRPDIRPTYASILGPGVRIIEAGALDHVESAGLHHLSPAGDDTPLVTLFDGNEVRIGKRSVTPLLQHAINAVVAEGAAVAIVLCTGHFEGLHADVPLIEPDRVLGGFMRAIQPYGRLGVVMPDDGQEAMMREKWHGYDVTLATASPYQSTVTWDDALRRFSAARVQGVVLDCMGFGPDA
jgi:protein AroM